jgi:lysophospholipase L1-like esterase
MLALVQADRIPGRAGRFDAVERSALWGRDTGVLALTADDFDCGGIMRSIFVAQPAGSSLDGAMTLQAGWVMALVGFIMACSCSGSDDSQPHGGDTGGAGAGATGGSGDVPFGGTTQAGGWSSGGTRPGETGGGGNNPATGGAGAGGGSSAAGGSRATGGALPTGGVATGGTTPTAGAATGGTRPAGGSGGAGTGGTSSVASGGSSGSAGAAPTGGATITDAPEVRLIGRMDTRDAAGPKFAWSGSGVIARFNGTSVGAKLVGGQQYTVVLDGTVKDTLKPTSNSTTAIATGLTAGEHTIELYRRTEANQGAAQFLGFDFGDGRLLAPPAAATRRLEVIGDSITCGYGNEGPDQNCSFSADTENHYLTYEAIAARDLGAELVTIAWSGKGVVCNYGDDANSCTNPLPTYYDRILPETPSSQWDFTKFQPDAVVINLGTNDLSTDQDPSQDEFESAYKAFLQHIREKCPNAYLLCTNGPMLTGTELDTIRGYIDDVVGELKSAGDTKVGSFEIAPQDEADGLGCDWHPSLKTHQKMALVLEAALKSALGW